MLQEFINFSVFSKIKGYSEKAAARFWMGNIFSSSEAISVWGSLLNSTLLSIARKRRWALKSRLFLKVTDCNTTNLVLSSTNLEKGKSPKISNRNTDVFIIGKSNLVIEQYFFKGINDIGVIKMWGNGRQRFLFMQMP